jgi:hypothetical protein
MIIEGRMHTVLKTGTIVSSCAKAPKRKSTEKEVVPILFVFCLVTLNDAHTHARKDHMYAHVCPSEHRMHTPTNMYVCTS